MVPTSLNSLDTPAALVDLDRMEANLRRVADYCRTHGLDWRPHCKTHKTPLLAARQLSAGACGVTVATLREAEAMADVADDVLIAYPLIGAAKLRRLGALLETGTRVAVSLDSEEVLAAVAGAARAVGHDVGVLVEADVGLRRVGVTTPEEAVAIASRAAELAGADYRGLAFYPGHIRAVAGNDDPALADLTARLRTFLDALETAGLTPRVVSGGSTPTLWHSHLIPGLTEIRPGTNVFNDRSTVLAGACGWEECAYSVLATVVSVAISGQAVVDAGSKALAKEEARGEGGGFGALLGRPVVVRALSEEHGVLDLAETSWRPSVGERVRVVPNHVCVSVNLQERIHGVRGDELVESWEVAARGRGPAGEPIAA